MLGCEGGWVRGGWQPVLVGCGVVTPDQAPGDAVAGVTSTAGVAGEPAAAPGAQDEWPVVQLD